MTGSTHAGMIAGFAGQQRPRRVIGIIDPVTRGDIPKDSNDLYAHLGGQPALNAYSGLFRRS